MTSSEERREVAASLRELAHDNQGVLGVVRMRHVMDEGTRILGTVGLPDCAHVLTRHADLIDPTCQVDVNKHGRAYCTNCGCDDWCLADGSHFCPNCGARVVSDGE